MDAKHWKDKSRYPFSVPDIDNRARVKKAMEPIKINGLPGKWRKSESHKYEYANEKVTCPVCGSVGWVWGGWYSCDGGDELKHVALVKSGDVYIKEAGNG